MTDRLVVFTDRRSGETFTMTAPPTSPWHALLDDVTEATIRRETEAELAERAHYAACGGVYLPAPAEPRRR